MLGAFGSVVNEASFHSLSSRFLNAFTVGAETKFTGRAFHKFTTRCVKKCLRTSSIDRPFSSLQDTNQFIGNLVGWIVIYIIHKQYRHKIKRLQLSKDTVPNHRVFT